jgi:hypothetical protein
MRRFLSLLVLLVLLLVAAPPTTVPAQASETWCFDDPLIAVGGRLVDIQVQLPVDHLVTMRSTTLTAIIPQNVTGTVLVDDVSAFPMQTTIAATAPAWTGTGVLPLTIVVNVAATTSYPLRVVATPLLTPLTPLTAPTVAFGTANTTLAVPMRLAR